MDNEREEQGDGWPDHLKEALWPGWTSGAPDVVASWATAHLNAMTEEEITQALRTQSHKTLKIPHQLWGDAELVYHAEVARGERLVQRASVLLSGIGVSTGIVGAFASGWFQTASSSVPSAVLVAGLGVVAACASVVYGGMAARHALAAILPRAVVMFSQDDISAILPLLTRELGHLNQSDFVSAARASYFAFMVEMQLGPNLKLSNEVARAGSFFRNSLAAFGVSFLCYALSTGLAMFSDQCVPVGSGSVATPQAMGFLGSGGSTVRDRPLAGIGGAMRHGAGPDNCAQTRSAWPEAEAHRAPLAPRTPASKADSG